MKRYQNNMADQELVVGSLRVLDKIEGGPVREIQKTVEAVRKTQNIQNLQQEQNWRALADDGLITPVEKQELLRNSKSIDRSFVAITQQAQAMGIPAESISGYTTAYNQLHSYLYVTLKLFDDMSKETAIDNRDTFNQYFSSYYYAESYVQLAIAADILDSINFRVLQSLDEEGEEGEIGFYNGGIYQYVDGRWKNLTVGAYKGPRTELPPEEEEAFFIASDNFTVTEGLIVNNDVLYVNNDILGITHTYYKGYIYYFQSGAWLPEWDKRDWKYSAAFADVINITGELPQIFQDAIDDLQDEIDDLSDELSLKANQTSLEDEIAAREGQYTIVAGELLQINNDIADIVEEYNQQQSEIDSKVSHLPVYYGKTIPNNPQEGDFYLYTTSGQHQNQIRRYHNGAWEWLADPEHNDAYRNYYMMALQDILEAEQAGSGYFSALFANAFWANNAVINKLETKTIYLQYGGAIQSANTVYSEESTGLKIDCNGNIDANGNTHIKGKVAIGVPLAGNPDFNNYEVVIGGNCKIGGTLAGATGTFSGDLSGAGGSFNGIISAQGLCLSGFQPGDIVMRSISFIGGGISPSQWKYKCIGTGTFRVSIWCWGQPAVSGDTATYKLLKNGIVVWSHYTEVAINQFFWIELPVEFEDIITCDVDGFWGRVYGPKMTVTLYTNAKNELMYLLSEPYVDS